MGSYPSTPQPEILPPADRIRAAAVSAGRGRGWASAPATYLLVGINCAVFLAMVARGVEHLDAHPRPIDALGRRQRRQRAHRRRSGGASSPPCSCTWASFTWPPTCGACGTWDLLAEPLMGSFGLFAVYILTGAAGNLLSTFYNWVRPHARRLRRARSFSRRRRSFGRRLRHRRRADRPAQIQAPARAAAYELKRLRKSVIYFAAINLVIGLSVNFGSGFTGVEIDNSAHIGGFLCGLLFAAAAGAAHRLAAQRCFRRACAWPSR